MNLHRLGRRGPNIVLIHGIPGSAQSWMRTAEILAGHHRVWVADLLGFGSSPRPEVIDAEAQAAALDRVLAGESVHKASIVGHDFGGPVALSLYRRRPDLFEGLALIATNAFPDTPIPFPLSTVTWRGVGNGIARVLFSKPSLQAMLWRYGGDHLGDPVSVRRIFTASLQELDARYRDYPAILQDVTVPALVLWGDRDPFFSVAIGRRTAGQMREVDLTVLKGGGHFLPEQMPLEVAGAIRNLVLRVPKPASATA